MWIETIMPYMWDRYPCNSPDVRSAAVIGTDSPCGKIRKKSTTVYPHEKAVLAQSTSWKNPRNMPIYGGMDLRRFQTQMELLHKEGHLSTDNRDLSTSTLSGQQPGVCENPLNVGGLMRYSA